MKWFVYIIETDEKSLYTGVTTDVKRRFEQHKKGNGAKFFRTQAPKKIVYVETCKSKGKALSREHAIKQMPTNEKRSLLKNIDSL